MDMLRKKNYLGIAALVFMILYIAECHTSRMYKKMLKDLIEEQENG